MSKVTEEPSTETRKADHIRINLENDVQFPRVTTGLERYRLLHQALPELSLADIDISTSLFGKALGRADRHLVNDRRDGHRPSHQSQPGKLRATARHRHGPGLPARRH